MSGRQVEPERAPRRPTDVCAELDIQPYVLKFWEGEFPQLGRRIGPKRAYGPTEVGIAREIRRLLDEEGLSLGDAREQIAHLFPEGDPAPGPGLPFESGAVGAGAPATPGATSREEAAAWASRVEAALADARSARAESLRLAEELAGLRARADEADALARELSAARERLDASAMAMAVAEAEAREALDAKAAAEAAVRHAVQASTGKPERRAADPSDANVVDTTAIDAAIARTREEMAETLSALRRELEAERTRVMHLQGELHRSWDEAVPLREENARITAEIAELRERTAAESATLRARIDQLASEVGALREPAERSVVLAAQVADDEAIIARQAAEIESLVAERDAMSAALEADVAAARDLSARLGAENIRLGEIAARVPGLDEALAAAMRRADAAEETAGELPGARAEIERLAAALEAARADGAATASALAHLHEEHAQLQERTRAGIENLSAFEELLAESERQREGLRTRAREEIGEALLQVRRLAAAAESLTAALDAAAVLPGRPDGSPVPPEGGPA